MAFIRKKLFLFTMNMNILFEITINILCTFKLSNKENNILGIQLKMTGILLLLDANFIEILPPLNRNLCFHKEKMHLKYFINTTVNNFPSI